MVGCAICGGEADQLCTCSECGRQVCDSCYVAVDMCTDCEETWEAEEDLDFLECEIISGYLSDAEKALVL
jgi:hypothetical protein